MSPKKMAGISLVCILFSFSMTKQSPAFKQLELLVGGSWKMQTKVSTTYEEWSKQSENLLTGKSYRIKGNSETAAPVLQETVELTMKGDEINYIATTANQNDSKPVAFRLVEVKGRRFTFSNPEHDFPQRIVYEFVNKDSLHAWIEGTYISEGTKVPKEIRRDFYYSRQQK